MQKNFSSFSYFKRDERKRENFIFFYFYAILRQLKNELRRKKWISEPMKRGNSSNFDVTKQKRKSVARSTIALATSNSRNDRWNLHLGKIFSMLVSCWSFVHSISILIRLSFCETYCPFRSLFRNLFLFLENI